MMRPLRRDAAARNRAWPVCLPAGDVLGLLCIVILRAGAIVVHGKAALRSHTDRPFLRVRFGTALLSGCRFWDVTHADEEHRRRPPQHKRRQRCTATTRGCGGVWTQGPPLQRWSPQRARRPLAYCAVRRIQCCSCCRLIFSSPDHLIT